MNNNNCEIGIHHYKQFKGTRDLFCSYCGNIPHSYSNALPEPPIRLKIDSDKEEVKPSKTLSDTLGEELDDVLEDLYPPLPEKYHDNNVPDNFFDENIDQYPLG